MEMDLRIAVIIIIAVVFILWLLTMLITYDPDARKQEYNKGYKDAVKDYEQQMRIAMLQQSLLQMQGGRDEKEEKDG